MRRGEFRARFALYSSGKGRRWYKGSEGCLKPACCRRRCTKEGKREGWSCELDSELDLLFPPLLPCSTVSPELYFVVSVEPLALSRTLEIYILRPPPRSNLFASKADPFLRPFLPPRFLSFPPLPPFRYSPEFKYRPAASPVIKERLKDGSGKIRLRGANPGGVV